MSPLTGKCLLTLLVVTILLPNPVAAEFYRYVDPSGVTRYTDNILEVPVVQRDAAVRYRSTRPPSHATAKKRPPQNAVETRRKRLPQNYFKADSDRIKARQKEKKRLDALEAELIREFSDLTALRRVVETERQSASDPAELRRIKKKIDALNRRIDAYDEKSRALEKALDAYLSQADGRGT